jgi:hypothetical protein
MNIKGQAGRIPKSVTLTTLQGTKELSVVAVILTASTNLHTDEREQNQVGLWATSGDSATIDTRR